MRPLPRTQIRGGGSPAPATDKDSWRWRARGCPLAANPPRWRTSSCHGHRFVFVAARPLPRTQIRGGGGRLSRHGPGFEAPTGWWPPRRPRTATGAEPVERCAGRSRRRDSRGPDSRRPPPPRLVVYGNRCKARWSCPLQGRRVRRPSQSPLGPRVRSRDVVYGNRPKPRWAVYGNRRKAHTTGGQRDQKAFTTCRPALATDAYSFAVAARPLPQGQTCVCGGPPFPDGGFVWAQVWTGMIHCLRIARTLFYFSLSSRALAMTFFARPRPAKVFASVRNV